MSNSNSPVVFCVSCSQALTSHCIVKGNHRNHRLVDLQDAVLDKMKKMKTVSKDLEPKAQDCTDIEQRIKSAKQTLEDACQRTEEMLNREYNELSKLLDQNRHQAFFILQNYKEGMKRQLNQLNRDTKNFNEKFLCMVEDIRQLKNRQENENSDSLLGEISALETSLATIRTFYSTVNDKLKVDPGRLKALENSVKKIVQNNKELLPRPWEFMERVTLDDSKKQENVQISKDRTELWVGPSCGAPSKGRTSWSNVLGSQSFEKGQHYWEVDVQKLKSWAVGVAEPRLLGRDFHTKALGHDKSSWVLEGDGGELSAMHNNDYVNVKDSDVRTLGVFVDCDKGRVKFYNVSTGTVLHSFVTKFKRPVCPIFSVQAQKGTDTRLKISSPTGQEAAPSESDIDSVSGVSTDSAYNSS